MSKLFNYNGNTLPTNGSNILILIDLIQPKPKLFDAIKSKVKICFHTAPTEQIQCYTQPLQPKLFISGTTLLRVANSPPPIGAFLQPSRPHGSISRSCTQTDDNTEQISTQEQKISQHTSLQPRHHLNGKFYRKASHLKSDATTRAIDS